MIIILGISAFYHDSAAAIIRDGGIIAAAQEERFTRKKHDSGFPVNAIKYCLNEAGVRLDELDCIVFYDKPLLKFERILETYLAYAPKGLASFLMAMPVWLKDKLFLKSLLRKELVKINDGKKNIPKLLFTEHHQAHAASAFFPSPFQKAAVLCLDGVGEWITTSVWTGVNNRITPQWGLNFPHSLGLLYSAFTYYTGFKVNSGEYKVMGLAPYGEPRYVDLILNNLIDLKEECYDYLLRKVDTSCGTINIIESNTANKSAKKRNLTYIKDYIKKNWLNIYFLYIFLMFPFKLLRDVIHARRIIDFLKPALIIIPYEAVGYFYDPVIPIALRKGINTITIPYCFVEKSSTAKWFVALPNYKRYFSTTPLINRLIAKIYPQWMFEYEEKEILRNHPAAILAYQLFGIARTKPWIDNYGFSKVIAVESQKMMEFYNREGIPEQKLELVGTLNQDKMYSILKSRSMKRMQLCQEFAINYSDQFRIVILSLPEEVDLASRPGCEFQSYNEIPETFLKPLLNHLQNTVVIINLHPHLDFKKVKYLEDLGVKISHHPIIELIPNADLYITATSATIRYAITCGVPVIDYDVFCYNDNYYLDAKGVVTVKTKQEYFDTADKILNDSNYYDILKNNQIKVSEFWGKLDGHAGERLINLINRYIS